MTSNIINIYVIALLFIASSASADWRIETISDSFTKEKNRIALIDSVNSKSNILKARKIKATLIAYENPAPGKAAGILHFNEGVPLGLSFKWAECYSRTCIIRVRFDDGDIKDYPVFEPSGSDNRNKLIINQGSDFYEFAQKSKKIEIRVDFYDYGNIDFMFTSNGKFNSFKNSTLEKANDSRVQSEIHHREINKYSDGIRARVHAKVILPPGVAHNLQVEVNLELLPSGDLLNVRILKSSGNAAYDAAVDRAVRAAAPFAVPSGELFHQNFSSFEIVFRPMQ